MVNPFASRNARAVSGLPTNIVNAPLTLSSRPLAFALALCHCAGMDPQNKRAGGCFLMASILIGFVGGLATGDAMRGVIIGTGVGIVIAVAIWLLDRARRR